MEIFIAHVAFFVVSMVDISIAELLQQILEIRDGLEDDRPHLGTEKRRYWIEKVTHLPNSLILK